MVAANEGDGGSSGISPRFGRAWGLISRGIREGGEELRGGPMAPGGRRGGGQSPRAATQRRRVGGSPEDWWGRWDGESP